MTTTSAQSPEIQPPVESVPPGEEAFTEKLIELLKGNLARTYPAGTVLRAIHAKHHGFVRAEFTVEPDLPAELRVGVFSQPRTFAAWVRFSNSSLVPRADAKKDVRGMAIKLLGVEGPKLLESEREATTQDFLLVSHPIGNVTATVEDFFLFMDVVVNKRLLAGLAFFFNPFHLRVRELKILLSMLGRFANPLDIQYWSGTPYLFGNRAVKYSAKPVSDNLTEMPATLTPDYLRDTMRRQLSDREARFDFMVQVQKDASLMPIEDARVQWDETLSPFRKVASLRIPPQAFDSPEHLKWCEDLSFNIWHSLREHRPLGGVNRARKRAYEALSRYRHERNQAPYGEPTT